MRIENIPSELKVYPQWINWKYEVDENGKTIKVPYNSITHNKCDYTNPVNFTTFDNACKNLQFYSGIGFCLTANDPFTFIDLDNKEYTEEQWQQQKSIFENIVSYAELSPSGVGLHIIVKGELPKAIKRQNIEMYTKDRYMTVTGEVYRNIPIQNCQIQLNEYYSWHVQNKKQKEIALYIDDREETRTDEQIINMASNAHNKELFNNLFYFGDWKGCGYPSQSEADLTLVNLISFYSRNRNQTKRIFLQSKLGQRIKSRSEYRLKLALDKSLDNQQPLINTDAIKQQIQELIEEKTVTSIDNDTDKQPTDIYLIPPGLVGDIAKFVYEKSPRPVPEVSLCAALGLMAGIVGRAYNISGTGLNIYLALIAKTGIGKEAIASGIDSLINEVSKRVPTAKEFIGPDTIASAQALTKFISTSKSFVSVLGEFGLWIQQISDKYAPENKVNIRRAILQYYMKSGHGNTLRQIIYSEKEKNTPVVNAPAFTIIGETTPITFYNILRTNAISEGLLPRFTVVEYYGERVPLNKNHINVRPSNELIEKLASLTAYCSMLNNENQVINVGICPDSNYEFDCFDKYADKEVNHTENELARQMWTRAHLKSLKMAALIAVGINPHNPIITIDIAKWSTKLISYEIVSILKRVNEGFEEDEYSGDQDQQLQFARSIIIEAITAHYRYMYNYDSTITREMHESKIVSYRYIYNRCRRKSFFNKDRMGAIYAIKRTIQTLIDMGEIDLISKFELLKYNRKSIVYQVMPTILQNNDMGNDYEIRNENNVINVNFNRSE